jgi:hypothetical protein
VHVYRAGGGGQTLELLENKPGAGSGLHQAEDSSLLGAHWAAELGSPHPELPARPRFSPGDFKGSTLDPDTVAHEHHSIFFPVNGHVAANAAGFGWHNGV